MLKDYTISQNIAVKIMTSNRCKIQNLYVLKCTLLKYNIIHYHIIRLYHIIKNVIHRRTQYNEAKIMVLSPPKLRLIKTRHNEFREFKNIFFEG